MKKHLSFLSFVALIVFTCLVFTAFAGCGDKSTSNENTGGNKKPSDNDFTVTELRIITPPDITEYYVGEVFDPEGMVLEAVWSDGELEPLVPSECEISHEGALDADDKEIVFTYEGKSVMLKITVGIGEPSLIKATYPEGSLDRVYLYTPVDLSGVVVNVVFTDGNERKVNDYTLSINGNPVKNLAQTVFDRSGENTVSVTYKEMSDEIKVNVIDGYRVEAEKIFNPSEVTGEMKNYVERIAGGADPRRADPGDTAEASGGQGEYLSRVRKGQVFRFHIWSDVKSKASITLTAAGAYMLRDVGWYPLEMGEMQFNKVFSVKVGTTASDLKALPVADSVKLPGCVAENQTTGDWSLWCKWVEISFGEMQLAQGDNIIEFTVISDYKNNHGESCAANIDCMDVVFIRDDA